MNNVWLHDNLFDVIWLCNQVQLNSSTYYSTVDSKGWSAHILHVSSYYYFVLGTRRGEGISRLLRTYVIGHRPMRLMTQRPDEERSTSSTLLSPIEHWPHWFFFFFFFLNTSRCVRSVLITLKHIKITYNNLTILSLSFSLLLTHWRTDAYPRAALFHYNHHLAASAKWFVFIEKCACTKYTTRRRHSSFLFFPFLSIICFNLNSSLVKAINTLSRLTDWFFEQQNRKRLSYSSSPGHWWTFASSHGNKWSATIIIVL